MKKEKNIFGFFEHRKLFLLILPLQRKPVYLRRTRTQLSLSSRPNLRFPRVNMLVRIKTRKLFNTLLIQLTHGRGLNGESPAPVTRSEFVTFRRGGTRANEISTPHE